MYRFVTVLQTVSSCISLLILSIVLPLMYNNVQTTIDYVETEIKFCEVSLFFLRFYNCSIWIFLKLILYSNVREKFLKNIYSYIIKILFIFYKNYYYISTISKFFWYHHSLVINVLIYNISKYVGITKYDLYCHNAKNQNAIWEWYCWLQYVMLPLLK